VRTVLGVALFISLGFAAATHDVAGPVLNDIR